MAGPYVTERDVVITTISVGSVNMGTETQCPSLESANDYSARLQCCVEAEFARNSYFDELGPVSLLAISATAVPLEEQAVESPPPAEDESLLSSGIFWAGLAMAVVVIGMLGGFTFWYFTHRGPAEEYAHPDSDALMQARLEGDDSVALEMESSDPSTVGDDNEDASNSHSHAFQNRVAPMEIPRDFEISDVPFVVKQERNDNYDWVHSSQ